MTVSWPDVVARSRGLGSRLLSRARLAALADGDLAGLAAALNLEPRTGHGAAGRVSWGPAELDRAIARRGAGLLGLLARWCGERAGVLDLVFGDEDRRSVRALLRGAGAGSLVPTPQLPLRALDVLAEQRGPAEVASLLAAWGHPYGAVLLPAAARPEPDLAGLEASLSRAFLVRARAGARRGDRDLREAVVMEADLHNATALWTQAGQPVEGEAVFVEGGRRLDLTLLRGLWGQDRGALARALGRAFADTPFAAVLGDPDLAGADLVRGLRGARLRQARQAARLRPLGTAPVLLLAERIRAEQHDLRALAWGPELGRSPASLRALLVTP